MRTGRFSADRCRRIRRVRLARSAIHGRGVFVSVHVPAGVHIYTDPSLLNHGCDPNVEWLQPGRCLMALREIEAGEELVRDYAYGGPVGFQCTCGSPRCREVVRTVEYELHANGVVVAFACLELALGASREVGPIGIRIIRSIDGVLMAMRRPWRYGQYKDEQLPVGAEDD